jgi:hypothetical protein
LRCCFAPFIFLGLAEEEKNAFFAAQQIQRGREESFTKKYESFTREKLG